MVSEPAAPLRGEKRKVMKIGRKGGVNKWRLSRLKLLMQ